MASCIICNKNKNIDTIIHETENWIITHGPLDAQVRGYFYMAPKRHLENWFEFNENELLELGPLIRKIEIAIREELILERLYTVTISEAVRHIHIHLISREVNNDVKGIPLIEQATLKKIKNNKEFNINEMKNILKNIKKRLSH